MNQDLAAGDPARHTGIKRQLLPVLVTLLMLVAVQVASFFLLVSMLRQQESHRQLAQVLFVQGTRVALFVQHNQLALLGLATADWETLIRERGAADEVAAKYEKTAEVLLAGDTALGRLVQDDDAIRSQLLSAELQWQRTRRAALDVIRADRFMLKNNPRMAEFIDISEALTSTLAAAAAELDRQMLVHSVLLERAQHAVPIGSLLLLAMLGVFSYYRSVLPLDQSVRALARSEAELREATDLLEERVRARTQDLVTANQAVRESEARLQSILNNTAAVVYMKDLEGRFLFVNRQFEQLFHVSNAELRGKRDVDVFPQEVAEMLQNNDQRALKAGAPIQLEETVPQDDGPHHYVSVKFPLFDEANQLYAVAGVSTDLTELKRAEEQMRQSQKVEAIGRLTGGIAHDFNNLLTAIIGNSAILLAQMPSSDPQHELISEIVTAGERAASLTHQLLAYSRKQVLELKVWDLNVIVSDMTRLIRRLFREDLSFVTACDDDACLADVDRSQVEQIIMNLVVNARDAMPHGGKLIVETGKVVLDETYVSTHLEARPGPHVFLAVTDTGRGIAPDVADKMFEPFFTTKEVGKGTGLGLSVVLGIVKQSGGSISVYSEVGQGTTFRIYFPEAGVEASSAQRQGNAQDPRSLRGTETILLVEDEEAVRVLAARVLSELGYSVLEARNGVDALHTFQRVNGAVDLLLTDVVMPIMGGTTLAKRLHEQFGTLPVVYMSGYTEQAAAFNGILKPSQDFLRKPFNPLQLARKLREVLDRTRATHQSRGGIT